MASMSPAATTTKRRPSASLITNARRPSHDGATYSACPCPFVCPFVDGLIMPTTSPTVLTTLAVVGAGSGGGAGGGGGDAITTVASSFVSSSSLSTTAMVLPFDSIGGAAMLTASSPSFFGGL